MKTILQQDTRLVPVPDSSSMKHKSLFRRGLIAMPLALAAASQASTDYGPAGWYPDCNFNTSGNGKRFLVQHDMEGYFASSMVYLAKCSTQASIHYLVNGKQDASSDY